MHRRLHGLRFCRSMAFLSVFLICPCLARAQAKPRLDRKLAHGSGQSTQTAVQVAFTPVQRDENGRPILPPPPTREGFVEADDHPLSPNARKEKALADSHKAPVIKKPLASFLGPGQPFLLPHGRVPQPAVKKAAASGFSAAPDFPGIGDDGPFPPDVAMAAGPNEILTAVNTQINVYDKLGNLLGFSQFGGSGGFYKTLGAISTSSWKIFDPVIHYDEYIKRFWLVTAAVNNTTSQSNILVALSTSPDATTGWSLFTINMELDANSSSGHWCDFPQFGFDTQAIYFSCDMFSFPTNSGSFQYGKVRIMSKSQFLKGTCCNWWDQWSLPWVVQPAIMRHAKDADGEYLVDAASNNGNDTQSTGGGDSGDTLDVWHFPNPLGDPSEMDQATASVSGYYTPPSATQPGPTQIDTGDARLLSAVWQDGHLSTTQTTLCGSNACAAFYELDVSAFPTVSVVNDWAYQQAGIDYYFPSVDENASSDKMLVFTVSADDQFASAEYQGIPSAKSCLHCIGAPAGLLAGGSAQYANVDNTGRNRWGDYFSASGDPDGLGVWVASEYVSGTNQWSVQVGNFYNTYTPKLSVAPKSIDFSDTSSGPSLERDVTVTNTGNADLTITSVTLTGSSDFSIPFDNCKIGAIAPPGALEAKQSCTIKVGLKPSGGGEKTATLNICSSAVSICLEPATVSLTFNGPVLSKVSPNNGPLSGAAVTITGDGLSDKFSFLFGSKAATGVSCTPSSICTMTAPPESAGTVDVVAKNGSLSTAASPNDHFTYQTPAITKLEPSVGPTTGGQAVSLTGVGFSNPMAVKFGSSAPISTSCFSDTSCQVTSPSGSGTVNVTATVSGVTSATAPDNVYTYAIFPSIMSLSAFSGPVTGGISITITGANFSTAPGGTIIKFGSLDGTSVNCSSTTQCTVTVPVRPASAGFLATQVTATVGGHTSLNSVTFLFGTRPPPPPKPPCKGSDCK